MSDNEFDKWKPESGNKVIDDPKARLMNRLRAILERTKSGNEAEAASAASMLERFLTEHNLSVADLEKRGNKAAPDISEHPHDLGKAAFKWKLDLAEGIAEFYYCASMVDRKDKSVKFVGRPDNVEALTMLYEWIINQIKDIAREARRAHYDETQEHIDPLRWQVAFGEGAVERLVDRLRELKARQAEDVARNEFGDVQAMVLHHRAEVSDWLEEKYGYRVDGQKTKAEIASEERWQKYKDAWQREDEIKDELKVQCEASGDMQPYWDKYPDEHPDEVARRELEAEKRHKDWERKERRNAARRTGRGGREATVDERKEDQAHAARKSGRSNADKVNLQPFLTSGMTDRKKVSNG